MRLTRKLLIALVLVTTAGLALAAWVDVRRGLAAFDTEMRSDTRTLATTLADAALALWRTDGQNAAVLLVESANWRDDDFLIRWDWLDEPVAGLVTDFAPRDVMAQLRRGRVAVWHEVGDDGAEVLHTFVPLRNPGPRAAAVEVGLLYDRRNRYRRERIVEQAATSALIAAACAVVAALLGLWFVGRPVKLLVEHARRVGDGDFGSRIAIDQRDEIGLLAREMNAMAARLARLRSERAAATEQLRHADRLTTVGRLASGVAHELGTPLSVIAGRAEMIVVGEAEGADAVASARVVLDQSHRMAAIIRQLLDFARRRGPQVARQDLRALAGAAIEMLAPMAERRRARIALAPEQQESGPYAALVDAGQLHQVLTNLLVNAMDAMPQGGAITVSIGRQRVRTPAELGALEGEYFTLAVRDEGSGIAPDALPQIFEPFFTTKDVGDGTGLGLSVAYGLIREHGGWIDVRSEVGRGATFTVYLPVARESALIAVDARGPATEPG